MVTNFKTRQFNFCVQVAQAAIIFPFYNLQFYQRKLVSGTERLTIILILTSLIFIRLISIVLGRPPQKAGKCTREFYCKLDTS